MHLRCIKSCSTRIFKIPVSLAEKFKVQVYANEDDFVSNLQAISIVISSGIINEYDNIPIQLRHSCCK